MADQDKSTDEPVKSAAKKSTAKTAQKAPAKKAAAEATGTAAKKTATKKAATTKADSASKAQADDATQATASTKASAQGSNTREGAGGTLKVHHLRPAPGAHTAKSRVGRGEAGVRGKTAGRGTKGTKARGQVPDRFEGGQMPLHMRLPKLRGFKNRFRTEYQVVNLSTLAELYPSGGDVTSADLVARGAVRKGQLVKVLGTGEISVKLQVSVDAFSASAKEKILAAGGTINDD